MVWKKMPEERIKSGQVAMNNREYTIAYVCKLRLYGNLIITV
jgi:hypothetical protein